MPGLQVAGGGRRNSGCLPRSAWLRLAYHRGDHARIRGSGGFVRGGCWLAQREVAPPSVGSSSVLQAAGAGRRNSGLSPTSCVVEAFLDFDGCLVPQSMVHESWKEDRWHRLIGSLTTFRKLTSPWRRVWVLCMVTSSLREIADFNQSNSKRLAPLSGAEERRHACLCHSDSEVIERLCRLPGKRTSLVFSDGCMMHSRPWPWLVH